MDFIRNVYRLLPSHKYHTLYGVSTLGERVIQLVQCSIILIFVKNYIVLYYTLGFFPNCIYCLENKLCNFGTYTSIGTQRRSISFEPLYSSRCFIFLQFFSSTFCRLIRGVTKCFLTPTHLPQEGKNPSIQLQQIPDEFEQVNWEFGVSFHN